MKKTGLLILSALAAASLSGTALADNVSFSQIGSIDNVNGWAGGTNLILTGDYSSNYALATMDGTLLSDQIYDGYAYARYGYFTLKDKTAEAPHNQYLFSNVGTRVIDTAYGKIDVENAHWAIAYTYTVSDANQFDEEDYNGNYYLYDTADIYYLDNDIATKVGSLPRANIKDYCAEGYYINIEDRSSGAITTYDSTFTAVANPSSTYNFDGIATSDQIIYSENGQQGIKDRDGNILMSPAFKYIYDIVDGYVQVYNGEKYGLTDISGQVIVPAEYDSIERDYNGPICLDGSYSTYVSGSYICVEQDGKLGYVDVNGNVTVTPTYSTNIFDHNGASSTYTDMANSFHILAADGVDTTLPAEKAEARALNYGSGYLYTYCTENYDYGLIDWHGNDLFPAEYSNFELSGDGQYLLAFTDYDKADLYQVTYTTEAAAPTQDAAPAEEAAPTEEAAPAQEATPAEADPETAKALINSALALAQADASANATAITELLNLAAASLDSASPANTILSTALTLIGAGTTDNVATLLTSALTVLG